MASRESTVGAVWPWFPIHSGNTPWLHLSQCEICVIPSHCKPCKPCKPEELSLEKQKPRENCNLPFFFNKYALRRVHGRPPVPVLHLLQGALWPWRWMQMSVSYGGGSKTGHSDGWRHHTPKNEEAIRDGPKHAEQKEGPQIGGANSVCLRFHVNKYIKYRLDSFYINISMQFR